MIFDYFDRENTITSPENGQKPDVDNKDVVYEHVAFSYNDETEILKDVNFTLPGGTYTELYETQFRQAIDSENFRKADSGDISAIERIYDHTHDAEEAGSTTTGWQRGIYPTVKTAEDSLDRGDMYVAEIDGKVVATGIINQEQVDVYADCDWKYKAPDDKVCVLHTLAVEPDTRGLGLGKKFVQFYEELARERGCEVLRIDTNERNTAARAMYKKLGYIESGIVPTTFNGIQGVNLVLMEKKL